MTVGGAYVSLDLTQLAGATASAEDDADAERRRDGDGHGPRSSTRDDDSPDLDTFRRSPPTASAAFILDFVLAELAGQADRTTRPARHRQRRGRGRSSPHCTTVLNPNNVNPALPLTDNVAVTKYGTTYTVYFQGGFADARIGYVDTTCSTLPVTAYQAARRDRDGGNPGERDPVLRRDTLDIELGPGNDMFNVQSTSAGTRRT